MLRDKALLHVAQLIVHDRQDTYGDSVEQLAHCTRIKRAVGLYGGKDLSHLTDTEIEALQMELTKISRIVNGKPHEDNWLDKIGYAAIAVESRHDKVTEPVEDEMVDEATQRLAEKLSPFRRKNGD